MLGSTGVAVPRARYLSATDSRDTMSAARASTLAVGSQIVQEAWSSTVQKSNAGRVEPPSTHKPDAVCTIRPVAAEKASACMASLPSQLAVEMRVPLKISPGAPACTTKHVGGVWPDLIEDAETTQFSFEPEPSPQGHV